MDGHSDRQVRDIPKVVAVVVTLVAVAGCIALGVTVHAAWSVMAATVLCVGVSLAPRNEPGHPERWQLPSQVTQAAGLAAVPASVAVALVVGNWWWLAAGAWLLLSAALVASELDKPKATDR